MSLLGRWAGDEQCHSAWRRRGIVIDCGVSGRVPLLLLRRYVDQIVALIVSHNDKDHHGGASDIIAAYPNAIDHVYFLQDRPVEQISLYGVVKRAMEDKKPLGRSNSAGARR